jgi:ferredoxin
MTEKTWRIEVSRACMGSGICLATAPGYFHLVGGRSRPVSAAIKDDDDLVLVAAELCPASAISVLDGNAGRKAQLPD